MFPSQLRLPGVHTQLAHRFVPGLQVLIDGHAVAAAYPRPSSLQRRTAVPPAQLDAPGVQVCITQRPARQLSPAAQAVPV